MFTSYSPVAHLVVAAQALLAAPNDEPARVAMATALKDVSELEQKRAAAGTAILLAREIYADPSDDDVEIDDDPLISTADEGIWIGMWGFISNAQISEANDEAEAAAEADAD